jgi:hypothetical protein
LQLVLPSVSWYCPTEHETQAAAPGESEYDPAAQELHDALLAVEYFPKSQMLTAVAPEAQKYPAVQSVQLVCPVEPWYLPLGQLLHAVEAEAVEYWPATQDAHVDELAAAYVPARQMV